MATPEPNPSWLESMELVRRAQSGDDAAFERLLDRYYPRVLGLVRARLGPEMRQYTESVDVVQETMGQVLRAFDRFEMRDEDSLVRWLARLVQNRLQDIAKYHRRARRDRGREERLRGPASTLLAGGQREPAAPAATPLEEIARREQSEAIADALASLDAQQRRVIELRAAGQTWTEVAETLELNGIPGARGLHARAMLALMKRVAGAQEDD